MSLDTTSLRKKPVTPKLVVGKTIQYGLLFFFLVFFLIPIYVVLVTSLKPLDQVSLQTMWELPQGIDIANYVLAWEKLGPSIGNSFLLVIPGAILAAFLGSLNGYVLSKWKFPGSDLIFTLILFGMFIPYQAILIPLVQTVRELGLYGGIPGLVLVHVIYGLPIMTLIFRNYYLAVPDELVEAALMDGSGILKTYWQIILPISIPAFIVGIIWEFTSIWNDFLFAVVLTGPDSWPVTVALNNIAGSQIVQWNVQMAAAVLASLPTILVYILLGKYFLRGMLSGSLKG
ncbi:MAG TPA: ABC transporter permease [Microbacteriaceae bacterium]|jgi:glucose/mannose transport system permease protein|nr:ABC transporter permease [Microbacteriaceae bacterium]